MLSGSKVHYFNIPGRGEAVRLAMVIGGVPFTDHRIEFKVRGAPLPCSA